MKSFLNLLLIILLPLTVGLSLVFYFSNNLMLQSAQSELIDEMRSKWQILSLYINPLELGSETGQRIRDISAKTKLRVTLIDNSGIVVDDSYLKPEEVKDVENHLNRPEVQDAVYSVEGHSIRYSETTGMEMLIL